MSKFYVYLYFSKSGLPLYVGKGKGNRWRHRTKSKNLIDRILAKHKDLPCVILQRDLTEQQAFDYEKLYIKVLGRDSLVNLTDGGEGNSGWTPSLETLSKMRQPRSEEGRQRMSEGQRGRKHPEEVKKKISVAGRKMSLEARQKISDAQAGRTHSEEIRRKISESNKRRWLTRDKTLVQPPTFAGRKHSEETLEKMRLAQRARFANRA
jgi:hypothetical protein